MKNSIIIGALALSIALPGTAGAATLLEIYQQALQMDPLIHEAEARRLASLEARPQARGAYLPQIDFDADYQTRTTTGPFALRDPNTGIPTGDTIDADFETDTSSWGFTLRQSVFRWDKIVNLRRADKQVAKAEADREAAQQDLIVRVVQRYFDVLAAEDRLLARHSNKNAIARQLEQAKQRFDVGLIAITDVQESQAAFDSAIADEIAAKRSLATAREFLREITGAYVSQLSAPGPDLPLNNPDPTSEAAWIDLALGQNLALVSSRIDEQLARDEISFRRNGHYPSLELVANVREDTSEQETTVPPDASIGFPGFNSSTNVTNPTDSISLQFNLPLFAGGSTSSRVREAVYLHRASRENLQRVTRETERQARDAYLGVLSEISRVNALERAVESNQTALEATEAGFEVGTRTIVDVLNAQFQLFNAIVNYRQSRYDYILNVMRLKQAAGNLAVQDLESLEQFLEDRRTPEQQFADEEAARAAEEAATE